MTDTPRTDKAAMSCQHIEGQAYACATVARALERELAEQDRILRDSVPERWKHATSPVGCVQNYIGELEETLSELFHHSSSTEHQMALIEAVLPQKI